MMKHNLKTPEIDRLEILIGQACDALPEPDPARLQTIRDQLIMVRNGTRSQKKLNTLPWWAVLLISGGLATAAWWMGENWSPDKPEALTKTGLYDARKDEQQLEVNQPKVQTEHSSNVVDDSPLIYQREAR